MKNMKGFTLFFAVLVGSLALAVGVAIYDLTVRELQLSSVATQSQYAIYAADTGAECALYWDNHWVGGAYSSAFATSSTDTHWVGISGVNCNNQDVTSNWFVGGSGGASTGSSATTTFTLTFSPQPSCAKVTVAKSGNPSQTTVVSHGYNTCASGGLQLERALQVSY